MAVPNADQQATRRSYNNLRDFRVWGKKGYHFCKLQNSEVTEVKIHPTLDTTDVHVWKVREVLPVRYLRTSGNRGMAVNMALVDMI